jgi:hypothetical protein
VKKPEVLGELYTEVPLTSVMEEADAELISRIFSNPPGRVKKVIDAAFFLHMDDLLRRLTAGIISSLSKEETSRMVADSRNSNKIDPIEVSDEVHKKVEMILFKNQQKEDKQE